MRDLHRSFIAVIQKKEINRAKQQYPALKVARQPALAKTYVKNGRRDLQ